MARLPAAPGAYGQPPVPPGGAVEASDAASRAAATLASAVPRVSWKWYARSVDAGCAPLARPRVAPPPGPARRRRSCRRSRPRRRPAPAAGARRRRRARRDRAGVRTAEGGRDVAADPPAALAGPAMTGANAARDSSTVIRMLRVVNASVAAVNTAIAPRRPPPPAPGRARSGRGPGSGRPRARKAGEQLVGVGELGDGRRATKLVASISRRPASTSSSMKRRLSAVGIGASTRSGARRGARPRRSGRCRPSVAAPAARPSQTCGGSIARSMPGDLDLDPAERSIASSLLAAERRGVAPVAGARAGPSSSSRVPGSCWSGRRPGCPSCSRQGAAAYRVPGQDSRTASALAADDLVRRPDARPRSTRPAPARPRRAPSSSPRG